MNIGIDARFYGSTGKGLGRYTQKLIEYLEKKDPENLYTVFLRKENFEEYAPKNPNFKKVLADYRWYSFSEQIFFPLMLRKYKFDLMHFPHFNVPLMYRRKFVLTIHDLILIHFPTIRATTLSPVLYWIKFAAYKFVIRSAIKRCERIFAVSKFTKKDILETYKKIPEDKICVTYEACEKSLSAGVQNRDDILKKYGIMKPYLIYIGNVYPHKNPERLVLAFKKLKEGGREVSIVFIGGEDYFYSRLKEFSRDNGAGNVIFAGFVPDNELDTLMSNSEAYVRPSLYEGFELPPLEAMSKGVPVLSSDHSCALEILGGSALYFDGKNVDDIADSISRILTDIRLRESLIQKGYEQIKKYSWDEMANRTLSVYDSVKNDVKK